MIAIDTNILARFYVDDPNDPESAIQRPLAKQILAESSSVFVPLTVILELEWVLRAFYRFSREDFARVINHLLGLPQVNVEDWQRIDQALEWHCQGLDFADALHLAASDHCQTLVSFDDKGFARRAQRLELKPAVKVPGDEYA
jgi:predicted nucleic-acid-binding protein